MIVPIPPEAVVAIVLAGLLVAVLMVVEVIVWLRSLAALERRRVAIGAALAGLTLGVAQSTVEWIEPGLFPGGLAVGALAVSSAAALTFFVAVASTPRRIALLGAALMFQFGWLGGGHVVPLTPILGQALRDARCERDPFCTPAGASGSGRVELRIDASGAPTVAGGIVECVVDPRPQARNVLALRGTVDIEGGGHLDLTVDVLNEPEYSSEPSFYVYLAGPLGGFSRASGEASEMSWDVQSLSQSDLVAGQISFASMHMERPETVLDGATGTLTWDCS